MSPFPGFHDRLGELQQVCWVRLNGGCRINASRPAIMAGAG